MYTKYSQFTVFYLENPSNATKNKNKKSIVKLSGDLNTYQK